MHADTAYTEHRAYLVSVAARILADRAEAEDVVQDAFARLAVQPPSKVLIAHCRLRGAVRGFRLGNITAAALRDERAPARDPAELRRELDRSDARAFLRT